MMIKKLTASFGRLDGEELRLHEGLNVICAPNESGKSTWCAFIRAMLYGIDSSERAKGERLPDKLRYAPWSGAPMQGMMELECDGRDITLARTTRLKSAPMREFAAVYSGTNTPVEGIDGSNAGEKLAGVSKDVFRRSAFVEQGLIAVSGSPELERRIASIVSTGDEDCSFTEADEQLRAWQRKRRYNKRGMLPELESEIAETKSRLEHLGDASAERDRLSLELERKKKLCAELEQEVAESRKLARRDALSNLQNQRRETNSATDRHNAALLELDEHEDALRASLLGKLAPEEAEAQIKRDLGECNALKQTAQKKASFALPLILALLFCAAMAAAFILDKLIIIAPAVLLLAAAVIVYVGESKKKRAATQAAAKRKALLDKYDACDEDDISNTYDEYVRLYDNFHAAKRAEESAARELEIVQRRQEHTESRTLAELDFSQGSGEAARLGRELAAAQADCAVLTERLAQLKGRGEVLGDPMVLGTELRRLEDEHREISAEYDALALAVETLREADADIQSRFSPELGKLAAHYMSMITQGRYESVMINRDFTARTRLSGDSVPRETAYLSAGTLDLMYLAVRLAVCKLALPEDANCPLVLDDTLVNLDAERYAQAMRLLREIAKERQVILFTCRSAE